MHRIHMTLYTNLKLANYAFLQDGWTALHLAAQEGKVDVVRLLTDSRAQVNIRTKVLYIHFVARHVSTSNVPPVP